ncbi:DUF4291 family protein [Goodfellowiella coeruleoviolacea]|uniref:DUF4291 family protein n=1 Tax=Goodfellowiella coeruleoviolacea TaxID=334858 RepID=UPI0020A59FAB|nr:DUF4291 family protein [Goodfellowiella coeruleoviolacea]
MPTFGVTAYTPNRAVAEAVHRVFPAATRAKNGSLSGMGHWPGRTTSSQHQIRVDHDTESVVVYQAYPPVGPSRHRAPTALCRRSRLNRTTWIKPSFRWLTHRGNWAGKSGQERVPAVRITRRGWATALSRAVLTTADHDAPARAAVHVQRDPERPVRDTPLNHHRNHAGIGRALIRAFTQEWVIGLTDIIPRVHRIADLVHTGQAKKAKRLLSPERIYPVPSEIARRIIPAGHARSRLVHLGRAPVHLADPARPAPACSGGQVPVRPHGRPRVFDRGVVKCAGARPGGIPADDLTEVGAGAQDGAGPFLLI